MGRLTDTSGCETGSSGSGGSGGRRYGAVQQGEVFHAKPEVDAIQRWLIERGHTGVGGKNGQPDGQFGDKSGQAFYDEIERIQKSKGIKPDGKLNAETMEALREESPEVAEVVKRMQNDRVGTRPSALDRIYNANRYENKQPELGDDAMCRAPGSTAPRLSDEPAMSSSGAQGTKPRNIANKVPQTGHAQNGGPVQYSSIANVDPVAAEAAYSAFVSGGAGGGNGVRSIGNLDSLSAIKDFGVPDAGSGGRAIDSKLGMIDNAPERSIGNIASSFVNRIRASFG